MPISATNFLFIRELMQAEAAIVLESGKEYLVETRLLPLVRVANVDSLDTLIDGLRNTKAHPLTRQVVEALTTNETSFFRDIEPFESLKTTLLPRLIERRKSQKKITIWSAACSSGQEPYSIAMLLRESFPMLKDWQVTIRATDLNGAVLEKAKSGEFSQLEVNRGLPAIYLVKYFTKNGNKWQVREDIRNMVKFSELNLIKPIVGMPIFDFIFIRNVLIYFDVATKKSILEKIRRQMAPDGYLFLGSAETTNNIDGAFTRVAEGKGSCFQLVSSL